VEAIPQIVYIKFHHWANNRCQYADGFCNSMIKGNNSHIPSPLIIFIYTALRHAVVQLKRNKCGYQKASKAQLKPGRPDPSNYFNQKYDSGKIASC
jgi:hypothetical protein